MDLYNVFAKNIPPKLYHPLNTRSFFYSVKYCKNTYMVITKKLQ